MDTCCTQHCLKRCTRDREHVPIFIGCLALIHSYAAGHSQGPSTIALVHRQRVPLCTGKSYTCAQLWLANTPFVTHPHSDRDCSHTNYKLLPCRNVISFHVFDFALYTSMKSVEMMLNSNTRQVYCCHCGLLFFEQNRTSHNTSSPRHAI
jgi:hypothetical protein